MSNTVTKGTDRNTLARIYDRLRKRSLRNILVDRTQDEHEAYVRGVRDGLNAAEKAGLLELPLVSGATVQVLPSYGDKIGDRSRVGRTGTVISIEEHLYPLRVYLGEDAPRAVFALDEVKVVG